MIGNGFILMGIGMATVFLFLVTLIIGMKAMSWFVLRFFPEQEAPVQTASTGSAAGAEIAIAIAAAKAFSKK